MLKIETMVRSSGAGGSYLLVASCKCEPALFVDIVSKWRAVFYLVYFEFLLKVVAAGYFLVHMVSQRQLNKACLCQNFNKENLNLRLYYM